MSPRCSSLSALALAVAANAQGPAPSRIDAAPTGDVYAAFDAARQRVVAFERAGNVFEWDGLRWQRRLDADPVSYWAGAAAYDPVRGRILVLGSEPRSWDGARFTPQPSLGPLLSRSVVFDTARDRLQLYENGMLREWDGAAWHAPAPAVVPPLHGDPALVYDPQLQRTVLYGSDSGPLPDCWSWDGSNWTQLNVNAPPGPRALPSMAWDPQNQRIVLYGGDVSSTATWTLSGSTWTQLATTANPGWRNKAQMVFDGTGMLLWGGNEYRGGELWRLDHGDWHLLRAEPPVPGNGGFAGDESHQELLLFGGSTASYNAAPLQDTWTWRGPLPGSWQRRSPASSPPPRYAALMAFSAIDNGVLLFGGNDLSGPLGDTWLWRNGNWIAIATPTAPSPRWSAAISPAPGGGVLLYGDSRNAIFDHWQWNGAGWTQLTPLPLPQLTAAGAAFDPLRSRTLLFGRNAQNSPEAWTWDGAQWSQLQQPPLQSGVTYSPLVAFRADVGRISIDTHSEIIEWDGAQWLGPFARISNPRRLAASLLGLPGAVVLSLAPSVPTLLSIVTDTQAEAEAYGSGCSLGTPAALSLRGPLGPEHPAGELLAVTAVAQTPLLFGFGTLRANVPLGSGCSLLIGNPIGSIVAVTDGIGDASLLLAVPPQPALSGLQLYCQAAVLDPTGGPLQGVSLSSALRLRLGR